MMDASEQIKQALTPRRLDSSTEKEWDNFIKALTSRIQIVKDIDTLMDRWEARLEAVIGI